MDERTQYLIKMLNELEAQELWMAVNYPLLHTGGQYADAWVDVNDLIRMLKHLFPDYKPGARPARLSYSHIKVAAYEVLNKDWVPPSGLKNITPPKAKKEPKDKEGKEDKKDKEPEGPSATFADEAFMNAVLNANRVNAATLSSATFSLSDISLDLDALKGMTFHMRVKARK